MEEKFENIDLNTKTNFKKQDYLDWTEYFMAMAFLAAKRSKDPVTQVGACVVNEDKKIVGIGYNGMPIGCSDDEFPWCKNTPSPLDSKKMYVCHAEMNAIMNKNSANVKNCTIYVCLFPCNECAKIIIQSGIKEVVYMLDKYAEKLETQASKKMLKSAGIKLSRIFQRLQEPFKQPDDEGNPDSCHPRPLLNLAVIPTDEIILRERRPVNSPSHEFSNPKCECSRQYIPKHKQVVIDFS